MIETSGPTAIYCRISEDRDGERLGVERQREDCEALAKRLGWPVAKVYTDNNLSASKKGVTRPEYQQLLGDVAAGKVQRIITDKPDRLYRRNTELEHLIDVLGDRVEIQTVKAGTIDLSTTTGRMVARILGATAQAEAETIKDRVHRKAQSLIESGAWKGGPRPFGWHIVDGAFIEDEREVALLRAAKDSIFAGGNIFAICADWKARGVVSGRGAIIESSTLKNMLISPRMVGRYPNSKGQWAPIFEESDWLQMCAILNARKTRKPYKRLRTYMLAGLLYCSECEAPMYGTPSYGGRPIAYYVCKTQGCHKVNIQAARTDADVSGAVLAYLGSKEFAARQARLRADSPGLNAAVTEMAKVDAERKRLATAYGDGKLDMDEWLTAKGRLAPRLEAARVALEAAQDQSSEIAELAYFAGDILGAAQWSEIEPESKRQIIRSLVERVTVRPHAGSRQKADPGRVEVTFRV